MLCAFETKQRTRPTESKHCHNLEERDGVGAKSEQKTQKLRERTLVPQLASFALTTEYSTFVHLYLGNFVEAASWKESGTSGFGRSLSTL